MGCYVVDYTFLSKTVPVTSKLVFSYCPPLLQVH